MSAVSVKPLKGTKVFEDIKVGNNTLSNKIVYAPTTRFRALSDHTPSDLQVEYYDKRSKFAGSLLVSEATFVSEFTGIYNNVPGIFNEKHAKNWKEVNDVVHANGSFMSCQLWALGRVADPQALKERGLPLIAPSVVYSDAEAKKAAEKAENPLRSLTEEEVDHLINEVYPNAAKHALAAGFDYVELHGAHGYLIDQFLQPSSNKRTDKYGGSIEKRAKFVLDVIDKLISIVGAGKLAIRLSPWAKFQGMGAEGEDVHPIATFGYLISELQKRADQGNQLAYISIVEPRVQGVMDVEADAIVGNNDFIYQLWKGVVLRAGNYAYDAPEFKQLVEDVDDGRTLAGFSRYYTSNPDLVYRLLEGIELTPYDRSVFYLKTNWGYNTYLSHNEIREIVKDDEVNRVAQAISALKA